MLDSARSDGESGNGTGLRLTVAPRFGRLRAPFEEGGRPSVRCVCHECGSHLLASIGESGLLRGFCGTCGSAEFEPLETVEG